MRKKAKVSEVQKEKREWESSIKLVLNSRHCHVSGIPEGSKITAALLPFPFTSVLLAFEQKNEKNEVGGANQNGTDLLYLTPEPACTI